MVKFLELGRNENNRRMNTLFELPDPIDPIAPHAKGKRCRDCKHIAALNPYSYRYWYCMKQRCNRTVTGYKKVKRMQQACNELDIVPINTEEHNKMIKDEIEELKTRII